MPAKFRNPIGGVPGQINADPLKEQAPSQALQPGLEHRTFADAEIKQAFDTFDLDSNRFVGAMEIRHILDLIGEEATDEEIDEMIRMCDGDGDGQVTFDEFYKMMTQPPPPLPPPVPPSIKAKPVRATRVPNARGRGAGPGLAALKEPGDGKADARSPGHGAAKTKDQNARAQSIESLVRRLSGGMDKIKPSQIKKIYKRFQEIDADNSGAIDFAEFCKALELEDSIVSKQMFRIFDMDGSGTVELKEFIVILSRYTSAAKTEKLKFAFMMFDEDCSGYIEREELVEMLLASFIVEGFSRQEIDDKCDAIYDFLGLPRDGVVSYEDFMKLAASKHDMIYPVEEARRQLKDG
mmetsp:Transcript_22013/g.48653  ORF Transcript_22013/g.48653 Transcript_22013/m.48653 type:complete len:351 (+) Transcript_22013:72-1124(+)